MSLRLLSRSACRRAHPRWLSSLPHISTEPTTRFDPHPTPLPATVLAVPTQQALDDAELDVPILPPSQATLNISTPAARQLEHISTREHDPNIALRIAVQSGGCHGYQYALTLTSKAQPDDYRLSHPTIQPSTILVDAVSMPLIKGALLDYATELIGSTFRIAANPQAKGAGCGCGVSWELKL